MSKNPTTPQHHPKYRPDIDGLRAIAVISVLIFHAFPEWLSGGFIGVDIFFVISGYLISHILFENLESGIFSFSNFYSRRIRRIFPALLLVLTSCYLAGWFILLANEFMQLGKHVVGGASFISNFYLWSESGYFDNIADTKPLLHLWSLAIEEQFYLVWPFVLWLVWKLRANPIIITLIIVLTSFIINIVSVYSNPVDAFYSPLSRFWELLIGSCLAYIVLYRKELISRWSSWCDVISILGLSLFLVGILVVNNSLFPGWWALLPTMSAAFLIFAGPNAWVNRHLLSNQIMVWFGLISFPLYLWHWPLLSFARIMKSDVSVALRIALVVVSIILAWLTYLIIERPIRKDGRNLLKVAILVLLMILVGATGWSAYKREGLEFRYRKIMTIKPEQLRDFAKWEHKGMYPTGSCNPGFIYPDAYICAQTKPDELPDVVVFGDSHAFSAYWGISKAFGSEGSNVKLVGKGSGCLPFINQSKAECTDLINQQIEWINEQQNIKTVIVSFRNPIANSASLVEVSNFEKMMQDTFEHLQKNNKKIVYLLSVPEARLNPRLCVGEFPMGRVINQEQCKFPLQRETDKQAVYRKTVFEVLKSHPNIAVFDPASVLCPDNMCSINSRETIIWMDENHISESASHIQAEKILLLTKQSSK
jgi:peptidoglycan/LPS O-acetylase OafA/YrhL